MKRIRALNHLTPVLAMLIGVSVNNQSALAAVHVGSSPWVWQNPLPQSFTLNAISCFTTSNCIAVGDNGTILATTDGGKTWAGEASPTTQTLRAVHCANTTNCAAVGDQGTILTTTNGGASWTNRSSGTATQLLGVFSDAIAIFAVGPSTILLSTDGGATWKPQAVPANSGALNGISCHGIPRFPVDLCFAESSTTGQVFTSNNTGFSWSSEFTPSNGPLGDISCSSLNDCVAVANDFFTSRDSVVITTNGGNSWSLVTVDHFAHLTSVSCVDNSSFCVAVGGSKNAFFSTNGGSSWTAEPNGMLSGEVGLNGVSCPSITTCFAVGDKGAITKTTNGGVSWTSLQTSVTDDFLNLSGVSCPAEGICYSVGSGGILATKDGVTWTKQSSDGPQAISCASTSDCVAVGTNLVFTTTDGGATWIAQTLPVPAGLDAISCPSNSDCFAGGTVMLATTNGGKTWTQQPFIGGTVLAIACASTKTCVAVGFGGTISRTTDGLHWTVEPRLTTAGLHGVSCPTASDCIAVGDNGVILASTNGGANWSFQTSHTTSGFSAVSCLAPPFVGSQPVCEAGTFLGEIFAGAGTWSRETQVEPVGPLAMSGAGTTGILAHNEFIAVGGNGVIVSKRFSISIGTAELTPASGSVEAGEPATFQATWTVPSGKTWRDLQSLDLEFVNESGSELRARFLVCETSSFALLDSAGNIVAEGVPGDPGILESDAGTLDLSQSGFKGTGPDGPSVTVTFVFSFKASGAKHPSAPRYRSELTATDVDGSVQGPQELGTFAVRSVRQ